MESKNEAEAKSPDCLGRCLLPALALLVTPFVSVESAGAACTPAAPVSDAIVTCSGTTTDQNGTSGYGDPADARNTINVEAGASVTGTNIGIRLPDQGGFANADIINNSGTISGASGIVGFHGNVNNNAAAAISGSGANGRGVQILGTGVVINSGTISGNVRGVDIQNGDLTNTSAGTISGGTIGVFIEDAGLFDDTPSVLNAGSIAGGTNGVRFNGLGANRAADLTNSGGITATGANGVGVSFAGFGNVANSGTIQAAGAAGIAIQAGDTVTVNNFSGGTISGRLAGIEAAGAANVNNAQGALIEATEPTFVANAIRAGGAVSVQNSGTIRALGLSASGIVGAEVMVNNSSTGIITATRQTIVGFAGASVNNEGLIEANSSSSVAIIGFGSGNNVSVTNNGGTIRAFGGGSSAIVAGTATVANGAGLIQTTGQNSTTILGNTDVKITGNTGTIEATGVDGIAIRAIDNADVTNSGTIQATGAGGIAIKAPNVLINNNAAGTIVGNSFGVFADNSANIFNSGTISGEIGIRAVGVNNIGSTITTSGTIIGTGGTAIKLSPAADTLTALPGSRIVGLIDMGGGADTININTIVPASRVSSLTTRIPANTFLQNVINFTGTVNTGVIGNAPGMPSVTTQTQFAALDPTAFGQEDRTLMDFTGGVASLVQGRLGGTAANVSGMQVVSFAPTLASDRTNEAFAAISAMAYGPERSRMAGKAPAAGYAPYAAPYNVWASGFGGARTQKGDDLTLRSTSSAWGGVIGVDRQLRSDLLLGAFAGGGAGKLSVEQNSQSVDTDYFVGGIYGRFDWVTHFFDFTLQAGGIHNKSTRLVLNDLAPGGSENAAASYNGWYVTPDLAYGLRYAFGNGYTLTPVARLRYFSGVLDGYSETGSEQNLVVGRRTLQNLEERAEIELSKITGFSAGAFKTSVHGGVIALQRLGSPTVNTVLIGQDLSFTTPGEDSAVGVVAGAGFDVRTSANMSLFGAFEGTVMSDNSRTAAAKGGLRIAF